MKTKSIIILTAVLTLFSCDKKDDIDTEKPIIHTDYINAFPSACSTIYFGEAFDFKALFSDNVELGAYSIEIHHNFDHHSHGHKIEECELDPKKEAVNAFVFQENYEIPTGEKEYEAYMPILIPSENGDGLFDEGDYHFQINLTDKEGWSTRLGLSIKMLHR